MSVVAAVMARSYTPDMFTDLTAVAHARAFDKPSGVTTLTFAGALDPSTATAIHDRMTSRDDGDQAARAELRTLLAAGDPELCAALARYVLGE